MILLIDYTMYKCIHFITMNDAIAISKLPLLVPNTTS